MDSTARTDADKLPSADAKHEHRWSAVKAGVVDFDNDVFWCRYCGSVMSGWGGEVIAPTLEEPTRYDWDKRAKELGL